MKGALEQFRAAHEIMHVPTTGYELARSQSALGLLVEAHETLQEVAQMPRTKADHPVSRYARDEAIDLDNELKARIPVVTLSFVGLPSGVTPKVTADDVPVPAPAFAAGSRLNPGRHLLVAKTESAEAKHTITLAEGEKMQVDLELKPLPKGVPAEASGDSPASRANELGGDADPPVASSSSRVGVFVLGGTAVAGLGTGALLGILGINKKAELEESCGKRCSDESVNDLRNLFTAANVSFAVGGAAAIAAVVWALTTGTTKERESTRQASSTKGFSFGVQPTSTGTLLEMTGTF